uniref:Uncharacterized protein n=1 Tax=Avena sativa TaxID=4498 RepID=A0ACD5Z9E8_AVESA
MGDVSPTSHPGDTGSSWIGNRDDRLSNLPDDILLDIVERLEIPDAVRTSILSQRWKQIPAMLSEIGITVRFFEPPHDESETSGDTVRANATMLEATRSILERRSATGLYTIHSMYLQFYLGDESTIPIGQTVAYAMATHRICSAEFTILTKVQVECNDADLLIQGGQFMSFVDACPNAFRGLTRLSIGYIMLDELEFLEVISICKRLEHLHLYRCNMTEFSLLEMEHPHLWKLEIIGCGFQKVHLKWLPKLIVLSFVYWTSQHYPFFLGYVPLLQSVCITNVGFSLQKNLKLSQLLGEASSSISELHLNFKCESIWVKPEGLKQFSVAFHKLRFVNLLNISEECDLNWTMFILQGAPNLEELCIMVQDHFCEMLGGVYRELHGFSEEKKDNGVIEWETSSGFKHTSLAVLRIVGFQAQDKFMRYIKSVMEAAVNLKEIYLHEKTLCRGCRRRARKTSMYPRTWRRKRSIRKEISKGMCSPVSIHFQRQMRSANQ